VKWIKATAFNRSDYMINADLIETMNVSGTGVEFHMISTDTFTVECGDQEEAQQMLETILAETSTHSIAAVAEHANVLSVIAQGALALAEAEDNKDG
jgi:hypothetical protein